ncbi:cis-zeatin O-beta-D-glucosyltransferase [Ranunculus cassubicifolius]
MESQNDVALVMVPLPAQGHLNQLLHLTRLISSRKLPVHFIGSSTHNRQAKSRLHGCNLPSNIHFHDFPFPQSITPPADPNSSNKFPSHLVHTFNAAIDNLREPLGVLLRELAERYRRVVVVHDSLMAFAAEEASFVENAEAYGFIGCSAFGVLHFIWASLGEPADEDGNILPKDVPRVSFPDCFGEGFQELFDRNSQWLQYSLGNIYDTCEALEGRFINIVSQFQKDKQLWAVGPFNPVGFKSEAGSRHDCLEWLDKQPPKSVIYVSFGTMTSISDNQIAEIAIGLERSKQKFLWVVRDADRGDIYDGEIRKIELPSGFEERMKGVGIIVRDWAPQLEILAHKSTGGFMSHCGWNSSMESLSMGVPIVAWPMHSDQPRNALLITEILKVGVMVREWVRREELISSEDIERSIRQLMVSDEGNIMREKARDLAVNVCRAISDGGTSIAQLESFISHISR